MADIQKLINDIDILKEKLNQLISNKEYNLQDEEIIKASQELDIALNKYNKLIDKKLGP